jgi:formate dehydrogenase iron-sulfur subunit
MAPRIRKCSFCVDLVREGHPTACSEACPTRATIFGKREDLLREAQERIRAHPDRYHARVYGAEEFGGSSVLMISDVPLEKLGLYPANASSDPLPELTASVLRKIPAAVAVGSVVLGGIWWITRRRMQIEAETLGTHEKDH